MNKTSAARLKKIIAALFLCSIAGLGLSFPFSHYSRYIPVSAARFEKSPKSYRENTKVSQPRDVTEFLYRYQVEGVEYSGKPLDAYRENPQITTETATVFYNPNRPSSFLLHCSPYIGKMTGTLIFFTVVSLFALAFTIFIEHEDSTLRRKS